MRESCPACHALLNANTEDCPRCGIIFSKWESRTSAAPSVEAPLLPPRPQGKPGSFPRGIYVLAAVVAAFLCWKAVNRPSVDDEVAVRDATALFPVPANGKTGYINRRGTMVIPPQFEEGHEFSEDLAAVKVENKWGYIDPAGAMKIVPQFIYVTDFHEGVAFVSTGGGGPIRWGIIDKTGAFIAPPQFEGGMDLRFSDGLACVRTDRGHQFIDQSGNVVIPGPFKMAFNFSDGLAPFEDPHDPYGFGAIDKSGAVVIPPQFQSPPFFSEGLAAVQVKDKWGYIDKSGQTVIENKYERAGSFSQGMAPVHLDDKVVYIDKTGRPVLNVDGDEVESFSEGMALFDVNGKLGYINLADRFEVRPQFDEAAKFSHGLAFVQIYHPAVTGYINKKGKFVWQENVIGDQVHSLITNAQK